MSDHNPFDRVRRRVEAGPELFESDKQQFTEKQPKLDHQAPKEDISSMTEDEFLDHVSESLANAPSDMADKKPDH